jgi:tetratricopeptide (TPR) repeat protein
VDYTFRMLRVFACALLLLVPAAASAQGRVTGVVRDAEGRAIKGATISAQHANFAASTLTATTDERGRYGFLGLRGGTWTFTVQAPGFLPQSRQATTRMLGTNPALNFDLHPAPDAAPPGPMAGVDAKGVQAQLAKAADLERTGKIDESIAAYRAVLNRVPALTSLHLQLGALLERKGDVAAATAEYHAALKADPAAAKARAALERLARR